MFKGNKILAFIPARGGSKGIKNKNIIDVNGQPLIHYTIKAALKSKYIDKIFVSTDSEKIKNVAEQCGIEIPFLRPAELAADTSKTIDAIIYTIDELKKRGEIYDDLIILQPTSPLRTVDDIDNAVEKFYNCGRKSLVSVSPVTDSPLFIRKVIDDTRMEKILDINSTVRRQDMLKFYVINGAIYINKISEIDFSTSFNDNEIPFIMAAENSADVDEYVDLTIVKYWLTEEGFNNE